MGNTPVHLLLLVLSPGVLFAVVQFSFFLQA